MTDSFLLPSILRSYFLLTLRCSNGCNYRPNTRYYHAPTDTVVLHGPRVTEATRESYWPESIFEDDSGNYSFPDDITIPALDPLKMEEKSRSARVKQYREHGIELPMGEVRTAKKLGVPVEEWGAVSTSSDDSLSSSPSEEGEEGAEGAEEEEEEKGFGMQSDCAQKCQRYHRTIWARLELTRRIRVGILHILEEKCMSLNDKDTVQTILDELLANKSPSKPFGIFNNLWQYLCSLLDAAEKRRHAQLFRMPKDPEEAGNHVVDTV